MFFKSLINTLNSTYSAFSNNSFDNINPNLVKYFRNEYGVDWKIALENHLHNERTKNDKKAA